MMRRIMALITVASLTVTMMAITATPAFAVTLPNVGTSTSTTRTCNTDSCSLSGQGTLGLYGQSYSSGFNVSGVPYTPQTARALDSGANAFDQAFFDVGKGLNSANLPSLP